MKFAKLFDTKDGGQVVLCKDNGDDGEPVLDATTAYDFHGSLVVARLVFDFSSKEKRDAAFDLAGAEFAERARKTLIADLMKV